MSSRALRKLQGRDNDLQMIAGFNDEEETSEEEEEALQPSPKNAFNLLNQSNESASEEEKEIEEHPVLPKQNPKKQKRKKKKKSEIGNMQTTGEDIDALIQEINLNSKPSVTVNSNQKKKKEKTILSVENRYLNPTNELKRIFGSRTLMNDASFRQRSSLQASRGRWLTAPAQGWPRLARTGINMEPIESSNKYAEFAFVHNRDYREIQFKFLDAAMSHDHNLVSEILKLNPYHVDSLLTLSDMFRLNDDSQTARDLIERALYCFESHFHSKFSMNSGKCRLSYKRPENRGLFLALYRHLHFVSQRGCHRTALELCKALFNLNPDEDPLSVMLFMDYFAMQAAEYSFVLDMCDEFQSNLDLPNWSYSSALAQFELYQKSNDDQHLKNADIKLQDALLKFPYVLLLLLDKCSVEPDSVVMTHHYFNKTAKDTSPDGLKLLCVLFTSRNHAQWKAPEVISWLERNVKAVLDSLTTKQSKVDKYAARRKRIYQKPPLNIYRYSKVSEISGISELIPPVIHHRAILTYDPLPPPDSIISYERPKRENPQGGAANPLRLFFNSMRPTWNNEEQALDDLNNLQQVNLDMQNQVRQVIDGLRDMIRNVAQNLNNENDQDDQADGESEPEPEYEDGEWD